MNGVTLDLFEFLVYKLFDFSCIRFLPLLLPFPLLVSAGDQFLEL